MYTFSERNIQFPSKIPSATKQNLRNRWLSDVNTRQWTSDRRETCKMHSNYVH